MMGWEKRYYDRSQPRSTTRFRALIAGVWLPVELAVAHYTACDRMELFTDEIKEMGKAVFHADAEDVRGHARQRRGRRRSDTVEHRTFTATASGTASSTVATW